MAQLPEGQKPETFAAVVVSHRWVELGREASLAVAVTYNVEAHGEMDGLIWFTPKAESMGRRALRSLGFDATDRDLAELEPQAQADGSLKYVLAGAKCRVKVIHEQWNGQPRVKADLDIPRDVPVGRGMLKTLGARLKSGAKPPATAPSGTADESYLTEPMAETPKPKTGPKPPPINPDSIDFDDIPFAWLLPLFAVGLGVF